MAAVHIQSHDRSTTLKHEVCSFIEQGGLRPDPVIGICSAHSGWDLFSVSQDETPAAAVHRLQEERLDAPAPGAIGVMGWATALEAVGTESPAFTACLARPGACLSVVILPGKVIWTPDPAGPLADALGAWFQR